MSYKYCVAMCSMLVVGVAAVGAQEIHVWDLALTEQAGQMTVYNPDRDDAQFGVWRVLRIFGHAQCAADSRAWYGDGFSQRDRLRDIPALTLLTPEHEELSSGVVTFALDLARGDRGEIVKRFWNEHNMILKPAQRTYAYVPEEHVKGPHAHYNPIRISTHIFNSEDEVEKMAGLMKKMLA